ncbi:MAG: helix-turn-helix domain-containing protein [Microbacterium sp.]
MSSASANDDVPVPEPPRRVDARRNFEAIVCAARGAFARDGVDASIEDVARAAGVGSATLYRHFPTRDDLILAALSQNVVSSFHRGLELLDADDPFAALREFLIAVIDRSSTYAGLPTSLLDAASREHSRLGITCTRMQDLNARLLERAQSAGAVRADLTAQELFDLATGIAWTVSRNRSPETGPRLLDLALTGLTGR